MKVVLIIVFGAIAVGVILAASVQVQTWIDWAYSMPFTPFKRVIHRVCVVAVIGALALAVWGLGTLICLTTGLISR